MVYTKAGVRGLGRTHQYVKAVGRTREDTYKKDCRQYTVIRSIGIHSREKSKFSDHMLLSGIVTKSEDGFEKPNRIHERTISGKRAAIANHNFYDRNFIIGGDNGCGQRHQF